MKVAGETGPSGTGAGDLGLPTPAGVSPFSGPMIDKPEARRPWGSVVADDEAGVRLIERLPVGVPRSL